MSYRELQWMNIPERPNIHGDLKSSCCQWAYAALSGAGAQLASFYSACCQCHQPPHPDRPCVGAAFQA